jgi:hypothetical protein
VGFGPVYNISYTDATTKPKPLRVVHIRTREVHVYEFQAEVSRSRLMDTSSDSQHPPGFAQPTSLAGRVKQTRQRTLTKTPHNSPDSIHNSHRHSRHVYSSFNVPLVPSVRNRNSITTFPFTK